MGWLEALTSILGSLAWPAVVVVAFFVFRDSLGGLLTRLTSYEGAGQKLTFGAEVEKAERGVADKIENAPRETEEPTSRAELRIETVPLPPSDEEAEWGHLAELAKVSGSAAVIEAWKFTEVALRSLAERVQTKHGGGEPDKYRYKSAGRIIRDLKAQKVAGFEGISGAIDDLSRLRNDAAHSSVKISENEALGYGDLALSVARQINRIEQPS